ncbi:porin [Paraburkholderia sp. A1RI-2L]|uniref:porin n=1 Tax=Paraburkholderia sp. A1RI-2L TaxID=3028367 RepID=UPI003B77FF69
MNGKVLLSALLGLYAGVSWAQGSVTLYGILDEGLLFNDNAAGHRQYAMVGSVLSGNRFGLRGSEDLGDGLQAVFTLENGFDINTGKLGQGGLMFGRQAWVGVSNARWGSVTFGRQYDASIDYVGPLAAPSQWGGYIVTNPGDIENYSAANHLNNSIKYKSASFDGLTFGGVYSLGGVAGDFTQNQIISVGANYANGWIAIGTSYLNARNPNASYYATSLPNATAATNNFYTPVNSGYASAHTLQMVNVALAWTLGQATLGMNYSNSQFKGLSGHAGVLNPTGLKGDAAFNNVALNLRYRVSPELLLGGQASYSHGSAVAGEPGGKYGQFDLGALYSLSKRTDLYATAVYQVASGTQSTGTRAVASIFGLTPSSSNRQAALRLAIRHVF